MTWILAPVIIFGIALAATGIARIVRDSRTVSAFAYALVGLAVALFAVSFLLFLQGHEGMLVILGLTALLTLLLGNLVGYPVLVIFLLWSGITVLRRESRTLGNMLALLAGVGLMLLPTTLQLLEPPDTIQDDAGYLIRYAVHLAAVLLVAYVAFSFGTFIAAALLYRLRRSTLVPQTIVVLGSGLINGNVPPLLAARLQRGLQAYHQHGKRPLIITSGGQGPDEPRPEGIAMREYLIDQGATEDQVVAETESTNTEENLRLSRRLLATPDSPVIVVTSSYHVFRAALLTRSLGMNAQVIGAPTKWYYLPTATLREFIGAVRDQRRIHLLCVAALTAFAVAFSVILIPAGMPPQ